MKIFIDGAGIGPGVTMPTHALEIDDGGLIIGQDQDCFGGCFSQRQSLAGSIDNLRIYSRALTDQEIQFIYNIEGN